MSDKRIQVELSAIFLAAALLVAAAGGLVGRTAAADSSDPYPNLYAGQSGPFLPVPDKTVFFTFDDGPSPNTGKVLDVLKRQGVPATFFVTAQNVGQPGTEELLRRIVDEGHTLGLHSYSHKFGEIYRSPDSYLADLDKLNNWLGETVGVRPGILRFPGGSATVNASPATMKALIAELERRGYQYHDWDVVSGDDGAAPLDSGILADRMVEGVQGLSRAVLLLHDSPAPTTSAQAVDQAIDRLREQGYRFAPLTQEVEPVHIKSKRLE